MPHPSILISFGSYGMQVLRSFLAGAAMRGALPWDEDLAVGALNERRLQGISLFWVPDEIGSRDPQQVAAQQDENNYELMDDLFHQINRLQGGAEEIRSGLAEGVEREMKRLLDPSRHGGSSHPGLDIYMLAQPTSADAIGLIRNYTELAMEKLAGDRLFDTATNTALLHIIDIFDFEDYWSPEMEPVRGTLQRTIDEGSVAIANGQPAAGRVYVFDSHTASGTRTAASRKQEVVLFLEFLLLEDIRSNPSARIFFEPQNRNVPPLCSIGIRAVERSSGMLRRMAAAAFAHEWLNYLASAQSPEGRKQSFEELLQPFRGEKLSQLVGEAQLRAAALREIAAAEEALLASSMESDRWVEQLRAAAIKRADEAIQRLSRHSGAQSAEAARVVMEQFREWIEPTVSMAIEDGNPVLPLGTVIAELQQLEMEFTRAVQDATPVGGVPVDDGLWVDASRMQLEYRRFLSRQVQTAGTKRELWPRLAVIFAVAFTPLLLRGLSASLISTLMPAWALASTCALTLALIFWLTGRKLIQPALESAAERAREYYIDPAQGRLAERVRRIARSGLVAGRIEAYTDQLAHGLRQNLLVAVTEELRRVRLALAERREEMLWLRAQLGEFLRSCQVDSREYPPRFQDGRPVSDVRRSLERSEDLDASARLIPRTSSSFQNQVHVRRIFNGWQKPYGSLFLYPLRFLDELSEHSFADPYELDEAESRRRADQIAEYMRTLRVPVCFHWLVANGLPTAENGCLTPSLWLGKQSISQALAAAGFGAHMIETQRSERLYLFHGLFGISSELLNRSAALKAGGGEAA
ncbi:MAG: hypothetical protein WB424_02360 [Terracidiphilus sp.]